MINNDLDLNQFLEEERYQEILRKHNIRVKGNLVKLYQIIDKKILLIDESVRNSVMSNFKLENIYNNRASETTEDINVKT